MDKNKYILMNVEELYMHFIPDILTYPEEGKVLIQELSQTQRYLNDYQFRAFVDTGKAINLAVIYEYTETIPLCLNLLQRTRALEMWQLLSLNLNLLGNGYYILGVYEQALIYYKESIQNEKKYNLVSVTPTSYGNIALIYLKLNDLKKAKEFLNLALDSLEQGGSKQPRYKFKLVSYLCMLVPTLCQMDQLEEIPSLINTLHSIDLSNMSGLYLHVYYIAEMYYAFYTGNYPQAKSSYYNSILQLSENDTVNQWEALYDYISLCNKFELDSDFYIEELLSVEKLPLVENNFFCIKSYGFLRKYYKSINNKIKYEKATTIYIEILEQNLETLRHRKLDSVEAVSNLLKNNDLKNDFAIYNKELKLIAEETIKTKNRLQETYYQIERINELGQKLISTLNLNKVIELIYSTIKENVPLDTFIISIADPEKKFLRSIAYYTNGLIQPEFKIDLDAKNSLLVTSYKKNKFIFSNDVYADIHLSNYFIVQKDHSTCHSVIFMPLNAGNNSLGICSIQSENRNVYSNNHIIFLKQLLPYLAIALNNAIHSLKLEQEISSHLVTQKLLEKANQKLERLSSIDSLTQISSRRDFEVKYADLIETAHKEKFNLGTFMFDIDDFKLYNDRYGHLAGDEALKKVAYVIQNNMNQVNGLAARFGGEEFIAACINLTKEQYFALANKIRQDIFDLNIKQDSAPLKRLTISGGASYIENTPEDIGFKLIKQADTCLYQAKKDGKNKIVIKKFSSTDT